MKIIPIASKPRTNTKLQYKRPDAPKTPTILGIFTNHLDILNFFKINVITSIMVAAKKAYIIGKSINKVITPLIVCNISE